MSSTLTGHRRAHYAPPRPLPAPWRYSGGPAAVPRRPVDRRKKLPQASERRRGSSAPDRHTINAHSTEVASCTFEEQRRVLDIAQDEVGGKLPLVNGIWADGSLE